MLARPASVGAMLLEQVGASASKEAFRYLEGERWVSLTWTQTKDKAFQIAAGLLSLGVEREDRVAIASGTRIEWILADLAIMSAGGATTTVYPSTQHEDVASSWPIHRPRSCSPRTRSRCPRFLIIWGT